jgi:hypothetical protein
VVTDRALGSSSSPFEADRSHGGDWLFKARLDSLHRQQESDHHHSLVNTVTSWLPEIAVGTALVAATAIGFAYRMNLPKAVEQGAEALKGVMPQSATRVTDQLLSANALRALHMEPSLTAADRSGSALSEIPGTADRLRRALLGDPSKLDSTTLQNLRARADAEALLEQGTITNIEPWTGKLLHAQLELPGAGSGKVAINADKSRREFVNGVETRISTLADELSAREISPYLFNAMTPAVSRRLPVKGHESDVLVQPFVDHDLRTAIAIALKGGMSREDYALEQLVKESPQANRLVQEAFVERAVVGSRDVPGRNFRGTVEDTQIDSVRIIDVEGPSSKESVPTWPNFGKDQDPLISRQLALTPLLPSTVERLQQVQPIFHSPGFRQAVIDKGRSPEQADAMTARLDWFVREKTYPGIAETPYI